MRAEWGKDPNLGASLPAPPACWGPPRAGHCPLGAPSPTWVHDFAFITVFIYFVPTCRNSILIDFFFFNFIFRSYDPILKESWARAAPPPCWLGGSGGQQPPAPGDSTALAHKQALPGQGFQSFIFLFLQYAQIQQEME